jgi:hypothetical protein
MEAMTAGKKNARMHGEIVMMSEVSMKMLNYEAVPMITD